MPKKRLIIIGGCLFFGFLIVSYLTAVEFFQTIDFDTTVKLQDNLPHLIDYPFSLISVIGSAELTGLIWLGLLTFALIKRFFIMAVALFLLPLSILIELFGKIYIYHPAPPHLFYRGVINFDFPSHYVNTGYAYPSGHVTRLAFLITLAMVFVARQLPKNYQLPIQLGLALLLVMVCISRVYLGEHWTSDVIGGLLLGSSFGLLAGIFIPNKSQKISTE